MTPALDRFHPDIRDWFMDRFRTPTDVQEQSWPRIAAGEHLLITAPTGSGKTLTAFLWAINAFATGQSEPSAGERGGGAPQKKKPPPRERAGGGPPQKKTHPPGGP
ncbi:MAG: DEAD/DEAH box helicase, partial [Gammaproteobacteria bacterium]|nr:DEAD/DEAH box helicase [Gammaproteobacteria bacterium]